jgi:hypothetical protein
VKPRLQPLYSQPAAVWLGLWLTRALPYAPSTTMTESGQLKLEKTSRIKPVIRTAFVLNSSGGLRLQTVTGRGTVVR